MKEDCAYWATGCGQPIVKPHHLRMRYGGLYHPSFCDLCHDYKPVKNDEPVKVIVRYQYINKPEYKKPQTIATSIKKLPDISI
jgi:hypothetical protein